MSNKSYSAFFLTGIFFTLLLSCSPKFGEQVTMDELVIFPSPPDTTRIQFLTSVSNSLQITGKRSRFIEFILGKKSASPIKKPYGITVRNGKMYICDTGIGGLEIMDLKKGTFNYFIPSGLGQLKLPLNCFVEKNGKLYIADGGRKQIVVFDQHGKYINAFGHLENFKPTDVFVHNKKIWVANIKNSRIHVYSTDSTHHLLSYFPRPGLSKAEKLYAPANVYVTDEHVYVSDNGDYKVKKYNHDGDFISSVGSHGTGIGQFARNKGIAVDRESNLYVVDAMFENAQIFNDDGKLLMFFGGHYTGPGCMWLPATIAIDYDNLEYFQDYVHENFKLKYLIFVTNQFGPDKINIYGAVTPNKQH